MTADEATSFGVVMRSLYAALKQVVQAERVYSSITLEGIPHFHVWIVPRGKEEAARGWDFLTSARCCSKEAASTVAAQLRTLLAASGSQATTGDHTVEQRRTSGLMSCVRSRMRACTGWLKIPMM
jgi:hypothetical protein